MSDGFSFVYFGGGEIAPQAGGFIVSGNPEDGPTQPEDLCQCVGESASC